MAGLAAGDVSLVRSMWAVAQDVLQAYRTVGRCLVWPASCLVVSPGQGGGGCGSREEVK